VQCGKPNKKGKTKEINWFYPLWNLGVGLGEPAPYPPHYRMVEDSLQNGFEIYFEEKHRKTIQNHCAAIILQTIL
jgi:hypothetical protein